MAGYPRTGAAETTGLAPNGTCAHRHRVKRAGKTRAEKHLDTKKPPTKRALKGARKIGRQDPEVGVTSRARKSRTGREPVPDPRYGGRPGKEKSKWRPPPGAPTL
jgi:hypothetical protein